MKFLSATVLSLGIALSSLRSYAIPVSDFEANVAKGLRLVSVSAEKAPTWVTEDFKIDLLRKKIGFVSDLSSVLAWMRGKLMTLRILSIV